MPFAQALGGEGGFGEVRYFCEWASSASKSSKALTGTGMPNIVRVDSFWDNLADADIVVFPFLGRGDLQAHLVTQGKRVWGNRRAELLELDRIGFRKLLGGIGMDIADADIITGLDALETYLKDPENDDRFLKASWFRGDMETHHHESWKLSEQWFRSLQLRLGPYGREIKILSEPKIEGVEPGFDSYAIDGKFPQHPMWGYEIKNAACALTYEDLPAPLTELAAAMAQPLRQFRARGNFHFECRITDGGDAYLTDPTIRMASPAGEALCKNIENWAEIVWHGSAGDLVEPEYAAPWVGQIVLKSAWSADNYLSVWVPPEYRESVYFHSAMEYDECVAVMPGEDEIFGSAVAVGENMEQAVTNALKIADSIEGYQVNYDHNALRDLRECFKAPL